MLPIASLEQQMPKAEDETIVKDAGLSTIGTHYSKHCRRGTGQKGNEGVKTMLDNYPVWWIQVWFLEPVQELELGLDYFKNQPWNWVPEIFEEKQFENTEG